MGNCHKTSRLRAPEDVRARVELILEDAEAIYHGRTSTKQIPQGTKGVFRTAVPIPITPGRIYDGDTYTKGTVLITKTITTNGESVEIPVVGKSVRLYGYDAAEMRLPKSLSMKERVELKKLAIQHKDELIRLSTPPLICILVVKEVEDVYGRLIAVVFNHEGVCINRRMLEFGCRPI